MNQLFLMTFSCHVSSEICVFFLEFSGLIHFLENRGYNLVHFICKLGSASLAPRANLTILWVP